MVRRGELTDGAWEQIAALLPERGQPGGRWRDHREVVNAILWKLRTGAPWRDLPERYGPWQTCYDRLVRWRRDGTWEKLLAHAQTKSDAVGEVVWEVSVDSTMARPPARRGCPEAAEQVGRKREGPAPRGRGTWAKPGRADDQAAPRLRRQGESALGGRDPGPARKRPDRLLTDRGCSFPKCRLLLRSRGIPHTIPERRDQRERRAGRPGRPLGLDREAYARRKVVERCVGRLKQWRGVATRYEKRAANYRAMVVIAALAIWITS